MIRWKYVIPRLTLLAAVFGLLWLGLDWALRLSLIQAGQRALGSRVEIGYLDTDLTRGQIELRQMVVAHPDSPFKNLFQAERATLDFEMGMALRKKLVVREGVIEGIRFHTERTESGVVESNDDPEHDGEGSIGAIARNLGKRGEAWFDDTLSKFETEVDSQLETVRVSKELKERWPRQYQHLAQQSKQIEKQGRMLRDQVKLIADDPLRNLDKVQPALAAVNVLGQQGMDVKQQLQQLQQQMQQDRLALQQAKQHDIQYVRERLRLDDLDGNSLSEYLLGPVWSERVETAMRWIDRSRTAMEQKSEEKRRNKARGTNVLFPGIPAMSNVLVRQLRLSGDGTVDGSPYTFSGTLLDLSHQPRRHAKPATLQIVAEGAIRMTASGSLDRRGETPVDRFVVQLPAVSQNGQLLGDPEKLAVQISPGTARIDADIVLEGEVLSGIIQLRQDNLSLSPKLPEKYTKYVSSESLQAALGGVDHLEARVTLSGQLRKPEYHVESNLGPHLASGMQQAIQQELAAKQQQLVERANVEVQQELDDLQQELVAKHGDILKHLEIGTGQLDQLQKQLTAGIGSPKDLISRGRKLFK